MAKLQGKKALVTGGTSGIGLATAKALLDAGAEVIVTGSREDGVAAARAELPGATVVRSDASSVAAIAALAETVEKRFGRLDIAFLNAGIGQFEPLEAVREETFDRQFAVNVKGPYFAIQKLRPLLADGSSIVVNTSVVAEKGWPATSVYAATKAALRAIVRVLAVELAPSKVRVNGVSPGPIDTPVYGKLGLPPEAVKAMSAQILQKTPLGRFGRSEEVANAVLFLASPDASFVTGEDFVIDGGASQT